MAIDRPPPVAARTAWAALEVKTVKALLAVHALFHPLIALNFNAVDLDNIDPGILAFVIDLEPPAFL